MQLAVFHLVGAAVDGYVPAIGYAGVRGLQVALRAVELAGLMRFMATAARYNAVLTPIVRIESAIGGCDGQVVSRIHVPMATAF